jgi:small subunit ribosomal protein S5
MAEVQQAVSIDPRAANRRPGGPQQRGRRPNDRADQSREEKIFQEYVVSIDRVARVVKGGRRFRFKALVAVGDGKQRVGVGVAKGQDVQAAVAKATDKAKKQLITFPVTDKATIPHEINAKVAGAKVLLMPARPGTGIIAGGVMRSIINLTGVTNLLGKALGSNNKVNNAYAVIEALRTLVAEDDWLHKPTKKPAAKKEAEAAEEKPAKVAKKAEAK